MRLVLVLLGMFFAWYTLAPAVPPGLRPVTVVGCGWLLARLALRIGWPR